MERILCKKNNQKALHSTLSRFQTLTRLENNGSKAGDFAAGLENAASVSGMLLITGCVITEVKSN